MKIVIAGGGTAGHVNPALALAGALDDADLLFFGTDRGVEARLVPGAGYRLERIDVRGFDRSRPASLVPTAAAAARAVAACRRALRKERARVLVSMGGYVGLPAVLAARSLRLPIVLHEQNVVFGLAHKLSKPFARRVCVSFEETLKDAGKHGVWTGNPIRPDIAGARTPQRRAAGLERFGLETGRSTLLVFGGSLGARTINSAAAGLARLWAGREDLQVLHVTGTSEFESVSAAVGEAGEGLVYRVVDYVDGMGDAYAVADLALCRGGATTVAELGAAGMPSVIVPYPHHKDRQQLRHGEIMEARGAALVLEDSQVSTDSVAEIADRLFSGGELEAMGKAAESFGRPDAARAVAEVVRGAAA